MKKRIVIISLCLLAIILGLFAWVVFDGAGPEPSYQGKPLSYWLAAYDPGNYALTQADDPPPSAAEAETAIRAIATNALPLYLWRLQHPDSQLKTTLMEALTKLPLLKIRWHPEHRNSTGLLCLRILGPAASNAVPELVKFFDRDHSAFAQTAVPAALAAIGPPAETAIPALLRALSHTNQMVRNNAAFALGNIRAKPELTVPALIQCLQDSDWYVRTAAVVALGKFGADSRKAIPALQKILDENSRRKAFGAFNQAYAVGAIVSEQWRPVMASNSYYSPVVEEDIRKSLKQIDPSAVPERDAK